MRVHVSKWNGNLSVPLKCSLTVLLIACFDSVECSLISLIFILNYSPKTIFIKATPSTIHGTRQKLAGREGGGKWRKVITF